jgi:hypothetical protein
MVTTSAVATLETCIYAERHGRLFSLKLTYHGAPEDLIRQLEATLRAVEHATTSSVRSRSHGP